MMQDNICHGTENMSLTIPGSHLLREDPRDCEDPVLIPPVEIARLPAGGRTSAAGEVSIPASKLAVSVMIGAGLRGSTCCSVGTSCGTRVTSGAVLLVTVERLYSVCGLS